MMMMMRGYYGSRGGGGGTLYSFPKGKKKKREGCEGFVCYMNYSPRGTWCPVSFTFYTQSQSSSCISLQHNESDAFV